jgi:hypothetical protein
MGDHLGAGQSDERPPTAAEVAELVDMAGAALGGVMVGDRLAAVEAELGEALATVIAVDEVLDAFGQRIGRLERCERTHIQVVVRTYDDFDRAGRGPFPGEPVVEQQLMSVPLAVLAQMFDAMGGLDAREVSLLGSPGTVPFGGALPLQAAGGKGRFLDIVLSRAPYVDGAAAMDQLPAVDEA